MSVEASIKSHQTLEAVVKTMLRKVPKRNYLPEFSDTPFKV